MAHLCGFFPFFFFLFIAFDSAALWKQVWRTTGTDESADFDEKGARNAGGKGMRVRGRGPDLSFVFSFEAELHLGSS